MWKSCSRCGKIHRVGYMCNVNRVYKSNQGGQERELRSSYAWTKKSQEIRERANYLCEVCRDQGVYTYKELEVHHIVKLRDDKELLLDNNNLVCLCVKHHKEADDGILNADYLKDLAIRRENLQ